MNYRDVDFIKIYNEAYAAEIAAPATVHQNTKTNLPPFVLECRRTKI